MTGVEENEQAESIIEGWRALRLFIDRHKAIRLFSSYLNDDPPRERILFFYGDGGNGKSLLLRFLRKHCCNRLRPEDWNYVKSVRGEEFAAHIQDPDGAEPVPSALLNFGLPSGENPQEVLSGLTMMRRALASNRLRFPLFDFAIIWYLFKTNTLTQDKLKSLIPSEEMDLIAWIVNVGSKTSFGTLGKVVLGMFSKRWSEKYTLYKQRRPLSEAQVEDIQKMDPEELINELPRLFAKDLNSAMLFDQAPKRIVLLFDTHEAFWGAKEQYPNDDQSSERDGWLRLLLAELQYENGIVAVIAGRNHPRWAEASEPKIPKTRLDARLIGYLSEADAMQYLELAKIDDPGMRKNLVAYTRVARDQVHPLFLGMCAEVVLMKKGTPLTTADFRIAPKAGIKGKGRIDRLLSGRGRELLKLLLKYADVEVRYAVLALSVCRAFDEKIYFKLSKKLKFGGTVPAFKVLTGFSFVLEQDRRGFGWYQIHKLVRRLARENDPGLAQKADEVLEKLYRKRSEAGNEAAAAEAIYHANRLDWERSVKEWIKLFDTALEKSNYVLCGTLIDVSEQMSVETDLARGRLSNSKGNYYKSLALYDKALTEYRKSIASFTKALRRMPDDVEAYDKKALALLNFGELQFELSQHKHAIESYRRAITACDEALRRAPDYVEAHSNKGAALASIADLKAELAQNKVALGYYRQAIDACDGALRLKPDDVDARNDKAYALAGIGEMQAKLSQHEEAIASYRQAIVTYDEALRRAPDDVVVYNNKGYGLVTIGELQAKLSRYEEGLESYKQAIITYDEVLRRAPDDVIVYVNKGRALIRLGQLEAELAQHKEALGSYSQSVAACDEALRRAPGDVYAHNNRGLALLSLGRVYARLSQYDRAVESYTKAIIDCDEALRPGPDYVEAHNNKGMALAGLGDLRVGLAQHQLAIESYTKAISAYDEALRLAHDDVDALDNKGTLLLSLGRLQANISQREEAINSLQAALAEFSRSLEIAPVRSRIRELRDEVLLLIEAIGNKNKNSPTKSNRKERGKKAKKNHK